METGDCQLCGHKLDILHNPVKRLRWSRHWWKGFASWFTGPLRTCSQCGAMYTGDGDLVAVGAVQTNVEIKLDVYRRDMAYLRDSFGGVVVAAELAALWLVFGAESARLSAAIIAASVGVAGIVPFGYFGSKVGQAKKQLKQMKRARLSGDVPG